MKDKTVSNIATLLHGLYEQNKKSDWLNVSENKQDAKDLQPEQFKGNN
ncbi:hypothetical protein R4036_004581 [Salmonella enterica]|nr:hypothetical protein [Salmonella enterica]